MDQAVIFGDYDHLLGIANIVPHPPGKKNIALIMLTPGMLHNAGPFRLHVDMALKLEKMGVSSLRFDLSGIGESLGVGASGKSIDRAAMETQQAMDYLSEQFGIHQFILFGLCSGADDSVQTALMDERVKGIITLDGLGYSTPRFKLNRAFILARKMFLWNKLKNKIQHKVRTSQVPVSLSSGGDVREFPTEPQQAAREFQQLVDRGTRLHFIYTGGSGYYNYAQQFYDMLPAINWHSQESVKWFPHMDHVIMLCEDRQQLVDHISDQTHLMLNSLNR